MRPTRRCLVAGPAAAVARVLGLLEREARRGWRAAAAIVTDGAPIGPGARVPALAGFPSPEDLARVAPDALVLASRGGGSPLEAPLDWKALPPGIPVLDALSLFSAWAGQVPVDLLPPGPFLPPGMGEGYRAGQRAADILVAGTLALLSLPLVALLALLVRLESRGAPLYNQTRLGLGGRPFRIWKLRSMIEEAEADGAAMAEPGDARITRVGRFLRRWRLDELPQLWNVLRGEMSLVGPRPEREAFLARFEPAIPRIRERLRVPPGVTGWAQVRHGYAATVEEMREKLGYDLHYVRRRSLLLDLEVLARTVWVLLSGRGVR